MMSLLETSNIKGAIIGILGFSSFAITDMAAKYLLGFYEIHTIVFTSEIFTLTILAITACLSGGIAKTFKTRTLRIHLVRGVFSLCNYALFLYAIRSLPLDQAYSIVFTTPFVIALLGAIFFKEKIKRYHVLSILLGFIGVLIVLQPQTLSTLSLPVLACILCCFIFAGYNILSKLLSGDDSWITYAFYPACVMVAAFTPLVIMDFERPALPHLFMLGGIGVMNIIGTVSLVIAFRISTSVVVAKFQYVQLLWGILFGYILFNDPLLSSTALGAAIIITAGLYLLKQEHKNRHAGRYLAQHPKQK
jgi:drug/metabolite transporter (DMT)-like permease